MHATYSADTLHHYLGDLATDADAAQYASYLEEHGWTLDLIPGTGQYYAYIANQDPREMTDEEWLQSLQGCFQ